MTTGPSAAPPGDPDTADLDRLRGWQPADPVAYANRQRLIAVAYRAAIMVWASAVLFCLLTLILTGSLLFLALGLIVTVPYQFSCYRYRQTIDKAAELDLWCDLEC